MTDINSPCSMPLKERYELASAYMEQYGDYVGNFIVGAMQQAIDQRDVAGFSNWEAIAACIDHLNGNRTIVQRDPPDAKGFSN